MRDPKTYTVAELKAAAERIAEGRKAADRRVAWLFANNLARLDEERDDSAEPIRSENPILFQLYVLLSNAVQTLVQEIEWLPMAAGVREEFPPIQPLDPSVFDGEAVNLTFERSPESAGILIGLEGASIIVRSNVTLIITYDDGEQRTFQGEEIAMGGRWELPDVGKKVYKVELVFNGDAQ